MIKVNLLRTHGERKSRAPSIRLTIPRIGILALALFGLAAAGLSAWWYVLTSQVEELTVTRDELRVENARLQDLKRQLDEFEKKKQDRHRRIDAIEQLRDLQTGPVLLLNHVIHSIPQGAALWLTNVEQKGDRIQITGLTTRGETLPDFMSNLANSGYFKTVDLELFEDQQGDSAKFSLVCVTTRKAPATE